MTRDNEHTQDHGWEAINEAVDEYIEGYGFRGDPGDHTPTEFERFLITDAIGGLLSDEKILSLIAAAAPVAAQAQPVTPADAVYGLLAWLSGRDEVVTLSSRHGAAIVADLAKAFCETNGLQALSADYPANLKYPASSLTQHDHFRDATKMVPVQPVSGDDGLQAIAALRALEQACDDLAAARTRDGYLLEVEEGREDLLVALDDARRDARRVIYAAQRVEAQPQPSGNAGEFKTDDQLGGLLAAIQNYGSWKYAEAKGRAESDLSDVRAAWDDVYEKVQSLAAQASGQSSGNPGQLASGQDREDAQDPLQPAANWLVLDCNVGMHRLAGKLMIGINRAQRLYEVARAAAKEQS